MSPSSSKAALLGSVHATPGVAGPRTPAEWWVLRAWACLDQGLNFPLKMRKRFMARSHESISDSLKLLSWWLLLSRETIILSPRFLSVLLSCFPSTPVLCGGSLRRSSPCPCSYTPLIPNFPLSVLPSLFPPAPPLSFLFLLLLSSSSSPHLLYSTLPTHDRLCN